MRPTIFFLSDFGVRDYYVAAVKAVILNICPDAKIVDVTHEIEPFNIRQGAFILAQLEPFLPDGAVVLAVVDPGVGTERKAIAIKAKRNLFVAPDNGLAYPASSKQGIVEVREILEGRYTLPRSGTFDARDIFGPMAAHLSCGLEFEKVGPKLNEMKRLELTAAVFEKGRITTRVLHVDRFGNIVTDTPISKFENWRSSNNFKILSRGKEFRCVYGRSYGELGEDLGILPGSSGFIEISLREKSAANLLKVKPGDSLSLVVPTKPI